jgi:hypothetical protein
MIGLRVGPVVGLNVGDAIGASASEIGGGGALASLVVAKIGDSGAVGFGTGDSADTGFLVGTPITAVRYNARYATATGPPPTFINFPGFRVFGALALYDVSGNQSMGSEMSLGPTLLTAADAPCIIKADAVTGSTLAVEWSPTGTYPAAGAGNLYHLMVTQVHALEAQVGRLLDAMIVELGTNDAANAGQAAAYATNMNALIAQLRIDFPGVKIVLVRPNPNVPNASMATVLTNFAAVIAGDGTLKLVETDDCPLSGSFHCTSNGYLSQGQREGIAVLDTLGYARQNVTTTPNVVGYGPEAHGTGNLTVIPWAGSRDGDLEVMVVTIGLATGTITPDVSWTLASSSGDATAIGVHENSSVYTRAVTNAALVNGHMPAATVTVVTATRNAAKIFTVRGPNLNPTVDAVQGVANNAINSGPVSITGVTTTAANELVMRFTGGFCGSNSLTTLTDAGLTSVRKVQDSACVIVTDREIITLHVGTKAVSGATGAASMTSSANMIVVGNTVSVKP